MKSPTLETSPRPRIEELAVVSDQTRDSYVLAITNKIDPIDRTADAIKTVINEAIANLRGATINKNLRHEQIEIAVQLQSNLYKKQPKKVKKWIKDNSKVLEKEFLKNLAVSLGQNIDQLTKKHIEKLNELEAAFSTGPSTIDFYISPSDEVSGLYKITNAKALSEINIDPIFIPLTDESPIPEDFPSEDISFSIDNKPTIAKKETKDKLDHLKLKDDRIGADMSELRSHSKILEIAGTFAADKPQAGERINLLYIDAINKTLNKETLSDDQQIAIDVIFEELQVTSSDLANTDLIEYLKALKTAFEAKINRRARTEKIELTLPRTISETALNQVIEEDQNLDTADTSEPTESLDLVRLATIPNYESSESEPVEEVQVNPSVSALRQQSYDLIHEHFEPKTFIELQRQLPIATRVIDITARSASYQAKLVDMIIALHEIQNTKKITQIDGKEKTLNSYALNKLSKLQLITASRKILGIDTNQVPTETIINELPIEVQNEYNSILQSISPNKLFEATQYNHQPKKSSRFRNFVTKFAAIGLAVLGLTYAEQYYNNYDTELTTAAANNSDNNNSEPAAAAAANKSYTTGANKLLKKTFDEIETRSYPEQSPQRLSIKNIIDEVTPTNHTIKFTDNNFWYNYAANTKKQIIENSVVIEAAELNNFSPADALSSAYAILAEKEGKPSKHGYAIAAAEFKDLYAKRTKTGNGVQIDLTNSKFRDALIEAYANAVNDFQAKQNPETDQALKAEIKQREFTKEKARQRHQEQINKHESTTQQIQKETSNNFQNLNLDQTIDFTNTIIELGSRTTNQSYQREIMDDLSTLATAYTPPNTSSQAPQNTEVIQIEQPPTRWQRLKSKVMNWFQ